MMWDEAAASNLRAITERCSTTDFNQAKQQLRDLFAVTFSAFDERVETDIETAYLELGAAAFDELADTTGTAADTNRAEVAGRLVELLVKKHHDYGPGNINGFGHGGLMIRLHDKLCRYQNLRNRDVPAMNESVNDTLTDIVGYCVVGLMLLDGSFNEPLLADARPPKGEAANNE